MPNDGDGPSALSRRKLVGDPAGGRIGQPMLDGIVIGDFGVDAFRSIEVERPEGGVDHVAIPIADGPGSERQPTAPLGVYPQWGVRSKRRRPDPEIVVQFFGNYVMLVCFFQVANLAVHLFE